LEPGVRRHARDKAQEHGRDDLDVAAKPPAAELAINFDFG
jgi:hypothetical protein